ncbi:RNA-binding S4 domain-containing protein [Bacteroides propionicifaciens]|jgi:ribosome-associated heat shock protein Hsp15|uniref:RNA-binding S4 domain-containing protein n=1 Tax=Bacteroides propionicifaciens TaxID=392838 RepID=UPI00035D674D|nr:RNA-binding S4 domain-containing protein [Bacteroides propionicifaciens]
MAEARLDKWLWAVRIFKTRSIAADACKKNRISVNNAPAKPSKVIKEGDIVSVRKPPITYSFEVLKTIDKRVGAKLVDEMRKNVTPASEYELLESARIGGFIDRAKGTGRPTKKDRRQIEDFSELTFFGDFDEDWDEE